MAKTKQGFIFLIIGLLFLFSCNKVEKITIEQADIDFVNLARITNKVFYLTKIDSLLKTEQNDKIHALLQLKKGKILSRSYKHEEGIKFFKNALAYFIKVDAKKQIAETYWELGSANTFLQNKVIANKQLLQALEYCKEVKDEEIEANVYSALSHLHFLYKDFQKSIDYIQKSIEVDKKDSIRLSARYNNLAVIYRNTEDYKAALKYNLKSLDINIQLKDSGSIAKSYNNLGLLSENLNSIDKAIDYYLKSAEINERTGELNSSAVRNLGTLYLTEKKLDKSKKWFLKALELEGKKQSVLYKKNVYNSLLYIALHQKNFKKSIRYQKKRDSLYALQYKIDLAEKLDLTKNQFELITKEKDLNQAKEINKRNKILFASITGILILLSLIYFQIIKNKSLRIENEKIDLEQNVLRSQMNPHFIFNALSAIQNSLLDNNPLKSATYLSQFAQLIRLNFNAVEKKIIPLEEEISMLKNYIATQKLRFEDKFDYILTIKEGVNTEETYIPPLFLQPFIENSIEHGFKNKPDKGIIQLIIEKNNNSVLYTIKDNGIGFKTKNKDNKTHAIGVFLRRLKLLGNGDEKTFSIKSSSLGTVIKFALKS